MGYRSNVAYIIRFKDVENLKKFVAINALIEDRKKALNECEVYMGGTTRSLCPELVFKCNDVKWYSSYEDVIAHEALFESLDDKDDCGAIEAGYRFVRVGEEDTDIETRMGGEDVYDPWDAVHVRTEIWMDTANNDDTEGHSVTDYISRSV
jgi:hypothetical protein